MPQIDLIVFRVDLWLFVVVVIVKIAFVALVVQRGIRAHHRQASTGREEMIGKIAMVTKALTPEGTVLYRGERWKAESEEGQAESGEEVVIDRVDSLKLYVSRKRAE